MPVNKLVMKINRNNENEIGRCREKKAVCENVFKNECV